MTHHDKKLKVKPGDGIKNTGRDEGEGPNNADLDEVASSESTGPVGSVHPELTEEFQRHVTQEAAKADEAARERQEAENEGDFTDMADRRVPDAAYDYNDSNGPRDAKSQHDQAEKDKRANRAAKKSEHDDK